MIACDGSKVGHRVKGALWGGDESDRVLAKHVQGPGFIKIRRKIKKRRENKYNMIKM